VFLPTFWSALVSLAFPDFELAIQVAETDLMVADPFILIVVSDVDTRPTLKAHKF
jgi:hypothetical protein